MLELVTRNYWWPGITRTVSAYVKGCNTCQLYKKFPQPLAGKLMSPESPVEPWKDISVNFIVRLSEAKGFNTLLVVVD